MSIDPDVDLASIDRRIHDARRRFEAEKGKYLPSIPPIYPPIQPIPIFDPSQNEVISYKGKSYTIYWGLATQKNRFYDNLGTGMIIKIKVRCTINSESLGTYYAWIFYPSTSPNYIDGAYHMNSAFSKNSVGPMPANSRTAYFSPDPYFSGFDVLAKYGKNYNSIGYMQIGSNCWSGGSKHREGCYIEYGRVTNTGSVSGGSGYSQTKVAQDSGYFYRLITTSSSGTTSEVTISKSLQSLSGSYQGTSYGNFATSPQSGWSSYYSSYNRPSSLSGYNRFFLAEVV